MNLVYLCRLFFLKSHLRIKFQLIWSNAHPWSFFRSLHPAWSLFLNCSWLLGNLSLSVLTKCVLMEKSVALKRKKGTRYIRGNIYFGIIAFSCPSPTKVCLRFLLISFAREIKGFYQSSLGNKVDFKDIMNISPNILAKN